MEPEDRLELDLDRELDDRELFAGDDFFEPDLDRTEELEDLVAFDRFEELEDFRV